MTTPAFPSVYRDGTHTCIALHVKGTSVTYIPLDTLELTTEPFAKFEKTWQLYTPYPVRRAAQVYLTVAQFRHIHEKAYEHLSAIVADKATAYPTFDSTQGKTEMASKATPQRRATDKPAKVDKLAAKPTVAAKPVDKPTVAAKPVAKPTVAAKPVVAKPTVAAKPVVAKPADNTKYKVADMSSVKRGFLAEYVGKAQSLKTFTRDTVEAAQDPATELSKMRTYFPYCVGKGIFAAA